MSPHSGIPLRGTKLQFKIVQIELLVIYMAHVAFVDKLFFTKHLAVMIKSGITLAEALESLASERKSKDFARILTRVYKSVTAGKTLSSALSEHPGVFDSFYIYMLRVGEESGTLEENLEFLSVQLQKEYSLQKKIKGALMYPTLVFIAASVMGFLVGLFLLPQLVELFDALEVELPLPTRILLWVAVLFKNYGILLVVAFGLFVALLLYLRKVRFIKPHWHKLLLHLPLAGSMVVSSNMSRICRNLGLLLKSGLPVLSSVETTSATVFNEVYKKALIDLYESVKRGKEISKSVSQVESHLLFSTKPLFPPLAVKMISVGEKTGKLDESFLYLSNFYEEEVDDFSKNLATILEPIMLLGVGIMVGFIAIAIIGPIYDLTGSLGR